MRQKTAFTPGGGDAYKCELPIGSWLSYGDNPNAVTGPFLLPPPVTG
jgi:hypothetical protein